MYTKSGAVVSIRLKSGCTHLMHELIGCQECVQKIVAWLSPLICTVPVDLTIETLYHAVPFASVHLVSS